MQIKNKIDRRTNKVVEENPKTVKTGDACDVVLKPMRPLVVETFKAYPPLGRFAVRDMRMVSEAAARRKSAAGKAAPRSLRPLRALTRRLSPRLPPFSADRRRRDY